MYWDNGRNYYILSFFGGGLCIRTYPTESRARATAEPGSSTRTGASLNIYKVSGLGFRVWGLQSKECSI